MSQKQQNETGEKKEELDVNRFLSLNHYEVLGVSANADKTELKKAHKKNALKYHPDRWINTADKERAETIFKKIQEAFETLNDEEKKDKYHADLSTDNYDESSFFEAKGDLLSGKRKSQEIQRLFDAYIEEYNNHLVNTTFSNTFLNLFKNKIYSFDNCQRTINQLLQKSLDNQKLKRHTFNKKALKEYDDTLRSESNHKLMADYLSYIFKNSNKSIQLCDVVSQVKSMILTNEDNKSNIDLDINQINNMFTSNKLRNISVNDFSKIEKEMKMLLDVPMNELCNIDICNGYLSMVNKYQIMMDEQNKNDYQFISDIKIAASKIKILAVNQLMKRISNVGKISGYVSKLRFDIKKGTDWIANQDSNVCMNGNCDVKFNLFNRRHHCRVCGKLFCSGCVKQRKCVQFGFNQSTKICDNCYQESCVGFLVDMLIQDIENSINEPNSSNKIINNLSMIRKLIKVENISVKSINNKISMILKDYVQDDCKNDTDEKQSSVDVLKDCKIIPILLDFVNNSTSIIWVNYVRKVFKLKRWNHFAYAVLYSNKRGFVNWTKIVNECISTDKYFAYGLLACEKLFTVSNYVLLMQKYMDRNTKSREGLLILIVMQYLTRNNMKQKYLQIAADYMKKKHVAKAMLFYYCSGISHDEWVDKIVGLNDDKQIKKMMIFCNVIDKCIVNNNTRTKPTQSVSDRTQFLLSLYEIYKNKLNKKDIESKMETLLQSIIVTKKRQTIESFMNYCVLLKLVNKNSDIIECIQHIMLTHIKQKHLFVGLVYLKMLMKLYKSYYCDHNTHLKVLQKINASYTDESSLLQYLKYSITIMGISKEQMTKLNKMDGLLILMIINLQQRNYKKCIVNGVKRLFDIKTMSKKIIPQTEMTTLMTIWMRMCESLVKSGQNELCVVGLSAVIRYKFDSNKIDTLPITIQMICSLLNTIYTNLDIKDNDNLYTYQWIASLHQILRELIIKKDTSIKEKNDKILLLLGCKQVCWLCDDSYQFNKSDELLIINCMKHKLEKAYYNLWYNQLFELFYEHIADFNMSDLLASTKWLIEKYLQDNIEDNPEQFQSFWYLLHALLHRFSYSNEDDEKEQSISTDALSNLDKASEYLQKALTKNIHDVPEVIAKILEVDTFWQSYLYDTHIIGFIKDVDAVNIEVPKTQHFAAYLKRLQSISQLKTVTLFEKYLLKRCADKNSHETALLYIDLGDIVEGISSYLDSQLLACLWIIESMKNNKDNPSKIYAYQKILNEMLFGFYSLLLKGVCTPILRTQYFKAVLYCWVKCCYLCESLDENVLSQINDDRLELLFKSEEIWKVTIDSIIQLGRVCILPNLPIITSACDALFFQMLSTNAVSKYLTLRTQSERKTQLGTQLYCNYYLFEGMWKGWNKDTDDVKNDDGRLHSDKFYETRLSLMDRLLENKQWNVEDIEQLLKWPIIKRDSNGFMTHYNKIFQLNLTSKNGKYYRSLDGITVDFRNGSIQLHLKEATNVKDRLFTMNDIKSIFRMQLSSAFFSLDQVMARENTSDPSFYYNPFQQFRFGPNRLIHSDYMATMFFTDYILKMITQSTEISSNIPFKQRKAFDYGFMSVLPKYLKDALNLQNYRKIEIEMEKEKNKLNPKNDKKNKDSMLEKVRGKAHRFWIEGDEIQYSMDHNKGTDKIVYKFGNIDMKVKKHLLEMNENGELVDAKIDDNDMSAEGLFAKAFTQNYDEFANYFPIFNRLKELLKICGAYRILQGKYDILSEIKQKVDYSEIYNRIDTALNEMRNRVVSNLDYWPINSSAHVSKLMDDTLRQNGVSRSQVQWSELNRVERDIQNTLNTAQNESINQLFSAICDGFQLSKYSYSNIKDNIYQWISNGRNNTWKSNDYARQNIATAVANKRYNDEMKPINNMLSQLRSFGFNNKINEKDLNNKSSNIDSMVHYVPAVFTDLAKINDEKELQYQVYGGVSMNANLRVVNRVNAGPGTGINRHVNLATINSQGGASRPGFGKTLANGLGIGAQDAVRYMNQSVRNPVNINRGIPNNVNRVYVVRRPLAPGKKWWQKGGNVAHSGLLLKTNKGNYMLEYMSDGKSHLNKVDYQVKKQINGAEVVNINGVEWTKQKQGAAPQGNWTTDKARNEMNSRMKGQYNALNKDQRCHSAQEHVRQEMGIKKDHRSSRLKNFMRIFY